jgi:hypothetical protein
MVRSPHMMSFILLLLLLHTGNQATAVALFQWCLENGVLLS